MEEREIVKRFLDIGIQLTDEAFNIVKKDPEFFLSEIKKLRLKPFFLTKSLVEEMLKKKEEPNFETIKEIQISKNPLRVEDYAKFYLKKYEKIKEIFIKNGFSAISINKIGEMTKEFPTIGLIKDKKKTSLVIEDPTGEIEVFFEGILKQKLDEVEIDDVVFVFCERDKEKFVVKKILHPDIPLNRDVKKTREDVILKITKNSDSQLSPKKYTNIVWLRLYEINFLIIPRTFFEAINIQFKSEDVVKLLKKRFLFPLTLDYIIKNPEDFVLEELPDIVITDLEPSICKNYKGTTIVSVFDKNYEINLYTREVKEI